MLCSATRVRFIVMALLLIFSTYYYYDVNLIRIYLHASKLCVSFSKGNRACTPLPRQNFILLMIRLHFKPIISLFAYMWRTINSKRKKGKVNIVLLTKKKDILYMLARGKTEKGLYVVQAPRAVYVDLCKTIPSSLILFLPFSGNHACM